MDSPPPRRGLPPAVKAEYFAYRERWDASPILPGPFVTAPEAAGLIRAALAQGEPFSMIRLGDGEGCALFHAGGGQEVLGRFVLARCMSNQFGPRDWPGEELDRMAALMAGACEGASLLTAARRPALHARLIAEPPTKVRDIRDFVGSTWVQHWMAMQDLPARRPVYPETWLHIALLPLLPGLVAGRDLVLVSCRGPDFHARLAAAWGARLAAEVHIPGAASNGDLTGEPLFPDAFPRVQEAVRAAAGPGRLVLVAAGLCAKPLCLDAAGRGAVALDLGSALDVLAGRPVRGYQTADFVRKWRV